MSTNGNGHIHLLDRQAPKPTKQEAQTAEVRRIVAEECAKVHDFYLTQIPHFVARMIQDALVAYGLVTVQATPEGEPTVAAAPDAAAAETPAEPSA